MKRIVAYLSRQTVRFSVFCYLIVLCLPMLFGAMLYNVSINAYKAASTEALHASVEQMRTLFDMSIDTVATTARELALDPDVQLLTRSSPNDYSISTQMSAYRLQTQLKRYTASNLLAEDIYLYFDKPKLILSSLTVFRPSDADLFNMTHDIAYDEAVGMFRSVFDGVQTSIAANDGRDAYLFSAVSISITAGRATCSMALSCEKENLAGLYEFAQQVQISHIGILNEKGERIVRGITDQTPVPIEYARLRDALAAGENSVYEDGYYFLCADSAMCDWIYVTVVPEALFYKEFASLRTLLYAYLAICLVVGGILSLYFASQHYGPIERILSLLGHSSESGVPNSEFQLIEENIQILQRENISYENELSNYRDARLETSLAQLIIGAPHSSLAAMEYLEAVTSPFRGAGGFLFLMDTRAVDPEDARDAAQTDAVIRKALNACFQTPEGRFCTVDLEGRLVGILSANKPTAESQASLCAMLEAIAAQIGEKHALSLRIALGLPYASVEAIGAAYTSAYRAWRYAQLTGDARPVVCYDIFANTRTRLDKGGFLSRTTILRNQLASKAFEFGMLLSGQLIDELLVCDILDLDAMQDCRHHLIDLLAYTLPYAPQSELYNRLVSSVSLQDLRREITDVLNTLLTRENARKNAYRAAKTKDILAHIEANYRQYGVSVESIADTFGLSVDQLTQMVRDGTGMSTLEYMQKMRLEHAKALLRETNDSIERIAEAVGLGNGLALNRVFKKFDGITPSQYRSLSHGKPQ